MPDVSMQPITEFRRFVDSLSSVRPDQFLKVPHSKISDESSFGQIRSYLVRYYRGIEPVHSFVDANGSVFDCIPVEQQFSLRGKGGRIPKAPNLAGRAKGPRRESPPFARQIVQLGPHLTDPFGNQMMAPEGTIPVHRLTFEDLARHSNLRQFFGKRSALLDPTHWYAYGAQSVDCIGGGSSINVWDPTIGAGQNMSLSQQWYTDAMQRQTVEVGWQVNPGRYGNTKPVFFIYWTADGYRNTGCYNLTCNAFVQTSGDWAIGGALPSWSTSGGPQTEVEFSFLLDQDKWWLYAGGETSADAVGYYPTSIFKNGPMANGAAQILFGGEVAGTTSGPPMGSGGSASAGWQFAAYQRQIHYLSSRGARSDARLSVSMPSPQCYTAKVTKSNAPWGETIWFGGPGGTCC
jgi:hypothetical protein